ISAVPPHAGKPRPVTLDLDASEVARKILHVKLVIPAHRGALTLYYPKWIPGEHAPTGPITDLAGLKLSAGGKSVAWKRDDADMYAFHCEVPAGALEVEASLDFLLPPSSVGGFSSAASSTTELATFSWNQVLLYPAETSARDIIYKASPLFGAHHYRSYRFLFALSDGVAHFGLEHHESSDDRVPERALLDEEQRKAHATLLPHEFVHSWNGKYRRPADFATPDFQQPMRTSLLWVYEGLTQYLGQLLAERSGLWSAEDYRDKLALIVEWAGDHAGRTWRPLEDTAVSAQLLYPARRDWEAWRRSTDFYDESTLIWLDADTLIREKTGGTRSLEDFIHAFHGGESGPPVVVPYTFNDVVAGLNGVMPYDWAVFLRERVESTSP